MYKNFYRKIFIIKKIYEKNFTISSIKLFFVYSINMPNLQQNNEIQHINKEMNLLQDLIKKNEKSLNQFKNGFMQIGRIRVKKGKSTDLFQTKTIRNIFRNVFQNKIQQIKKNANLRQNTLAHVKKRKRFFEKGLKKLAKMQNISQN